MHWFVVVIAAAVGAIVGPTLIWSRQGLAVPPGLIFYAVLFGVVIGAFVGLIGALGFTAGKGKPQSVLLGGAGLAVGWLAYFTLLLAQGFAPDAALISIALVTIALGCVFFLVVQRHQNRKRGDEALTK